MAIIAQGELVGNPFVRNFHPHQGDRVLSLGQQRHVRIVTALNEETGEMVFKPARLAPIAISLIPHISLTQGNIFDHALQKPSLKTARKQGASSSGVNMDVVWQSRGGDPDYRPEKARGFKFSSTALEIAEERKRKKQQAQDAIFYQPHP